MVASRVAVFHRPSPAFVTLSDRYTAEYYVCGDGEPLVIVPGLAGGAQLLDPLVEELAGEYQVIWYELRGETYDFCDRTYHFDRLVRDLAEFIGCLGLERPGLMGLSFGGAIALDYATRWPNRLDFLAIQGAGASHHSGPFDGVARRVLERLQLPDNNPFVNQFFRVLTADRTSVGGRFDFIVNQCWRTDQSVMAHRFSLLEEYNVADRLARLTVPTLALCGERDVLVHPSAVEQMRSVAPQMETSVLPDAGHFAFVTHPELVAEALREFRRGVPALSGDAR